MFGLVNFRINRVLQNTRRGGGIGDYRALSSEGEEVDDVDIRQWILADDCDVGHQMYMIMTSCPLYCWRKVVKMIRMKVIQTKLQRK
jgi:hypothetical protein